MNRVVQDVESKKRKLQAIFAEGTPQLAANTLCPFITEHQSPVLTAVQRLDKTEGGFLRDDLHPTQRPAQGGAGHQLRDEGMLYRFRSVMEALQLRGPGEAGMRTARLFSAASKGARYPLCVILLRMYECLSSSLFTQVMRASLKNASGSGGISCAPVTCTAKANVPETMVFLMQQRMESSLTTPGSWTTVMCSSQ